MHQSVQCADCVYSTDMLCLQAVCGQHVEWARATLPVYAVFIGLACSVNTSDLCDTAYRAWHEGHDPMHASHTETILSNQLNRYSK